MSHVTIVGLRGLSANLHQNPAYVSRSLLVVFTSPRPGIVMRRAKISTGKSRTTTDHRTHVGIVRRGRTRARIIEAAIAAFSEPGVEGGPAIDDLIRAANVSRATFYNHFKTIGEVVEAAIDVLSRDLRQAIVTYNEPIKEVDLRLASGMRRYILWASENLKWRAFMARLPVIGRSVQARVRRDLREGLAGGAFKFVSLSAAEDLVVGASLQTIRRLASAGTSSKENFNPDAIIEVVMRGLGVSPARLRQIMHVSGTYP